MNKTITVIMAMLLLSCSAKFKNLATLFDKELSTSKRHLALPNRLTIYRDSTFEYFQGNAFYVQYAKGRWKIYDKSNIVLNSYNSQQRQVYKNNILDSVYLTLKDATLNIKNKKHVIFQDQIFYVISK